MPEREPSFEPNTYQPSVPETHEAAPEIENKLNNPQFLEGQFRLPKEQWDEQFRVLVQQKSEENQRMIQEAEESLGKEFEESPQETSSRSPEVIRQETFERYVRGLGLSGEDLRGKSILDLGCHEGEFVEQLIKENITSEAYGLEANEEVAIKEDLKDHVLRGNFAKKLPKENLDYVVSVGAVSNYISEGKEGAEAIEDTIKNSLDSLKESGEVRIYPIQEAQENSELVGLIESRKSWGSLAEKISKEEGVTCSIEPRAVKVIGKNNDVILESVLVIRKLPEKERQWQSFEKQFKETTDALGYEIEPKIMDTVVGLNAIGISTYQSCEGHVDRGRIAPWVDVSAPNEPKKKFEKSTISDKEIYEKNDVSEELLTKSKKLEGKFKREMKKREIEMDDMKERKKLAKELMAELEISKEEAKKLSKAAKQIDRSKHTPTPEYKKWMEANEELVKKAEALVAEFNQGRDRPEGSRIKTQPRGYGAAIYNGGEDYETANTERTEQEKEELKSRLESYRAEFKEFAEFLKKKFFES